MNWYKQSQFENIEFIEDNPIEKYMDIGHSEVYEYGDGTQSNDDPVNYIWVFYNGEILSVEEDWDAPVHETAFPDLNLSKLFTGRYETVSGRLSVYRPTQGDAKYRVTPKFIQYKLYQAFPNVKQMYEF